MVDLTNIAEYGAVTTLECMHVVQHHTGGRTLGQVYERSSDNIHKQSNEHFLFTC